MAKDRRYITVKNLFAGGYIKSLQDIFDNVPKSVVASDLGMNNIRFSKLINNLDRFVLKDIYRLAYIIEVDESVILNLVHQQYMESKKHKK